MVMRVGSLLPHYPNAEPAVEGGVRPKGEVALCRQEHARRLRISGGVARALTQDRSVAIVAQTVSPDAVHGHGEQGNQLMVELDWVVAQSGGGLVWPARGSIPLWVRWSGPNANLQSAI